MDYIEMQAHASLVDRMRCPKCRSELAFVSASGVHADFSDDDIARRCTNTHCNFACVVGDRRCACGEVYAQYDVDTRYPTCPTCRVFPVVCPACGAHPFNTARRGTVCRPARAWYAPWKRRPQWAIICRACQRTVGHEWRRVLDVGGMAHRFLDPSEDTRPYHIVPPSSKGRIH